jgi:choline dehydrogenase-like flavoprotein
MSKPAPTTTDAAYDYIIVGSGAGGAPLAARLAQADRRVLVLEAGPRHADLSATAPAHEVTRVPALHAVSTEHPDVAWRFFVEHYRSGLDGKPLNRDIEKDPKWHDPDAAAGEGEQQRGIFYPRATGVGGCTIHNAMITIAGPDSDWDEIAEQLGDPSWRGERMRAYFQKLEHNDYLPVPNTSPPTPFIAMWRYVWTSVGWVLSAFPFIGSLIGRNPDPTSGRHGFQGWLHTSTADLNLGLRDRQLRKMLKAALWQSKKSGLGRAWSLVSTFLNGRYRQTLDPNHNETQEKSPEGVALIPIAVHGIRTNITQNSQSPFGQRGRRSSPRELLHEAEITCKGNLEVRTGCLVTRVLLDNSSPPRAIGVEYLRGERLYRACIDPQNPAVDTQVAMVKDSGEVIVCGGTFNTPQLLMLSGIGPRTSAGKIGVDGSDPLRCREEPWSSGNDCRVKLAGVGRNLSDRYEVSVVSTMKNDFELLDGAKLTLSASQDQPDEQLREWRDQGTGLYASNGGVLAILKRSNPFLAQPDLFIFGLPFEFKGYKVGYSQPPAHNKFTWVVLKSHSQNRGGLVRLRTDSPLDTPLINFHSFSAFSDEDGGRNDPDVRALAEGVKFVRRILKHAKSVVADEHHPGPAVVPPGNDDKLHAWIRSDAWGHHACGTCRMGADDDPLAVLDSRFRVRGVQGLRVVDASIFPKIPGYFIVTNIYMASEKAADVILEATSVTSTGRPAVYPTELRDREVEAMNGRRRQLPLDDQHSPQLVGDVGSNATGSATGDWSDDLTGLALSGGGIRSATLCLGVLQGLARTHWLRRVDMLSTVSGGGYIGAFLGRCYDRLKPSPALEFPVNPTLAVERSLSDNDSPPLSWLRKHGNYLAPQGVGDGRLNFAVFVRNLLSVHLVVGLALFTAFGLANGLRYSVLDKSLTTAGLAFDCSDLPIGHLVSSFVGPFFSPWFLLWEFLILFMAVPLIAGYWIVSEDVHQSFKRGPLIALVVTAATLLILGVKDGLVPELVLSGSSLLTSLIFVEIAWRRGDRREAAVGSGSVETQRARTRNYLTYDLSIALAMTGVAAAFVIIDTLGHGLQEWKIQDNPVYARAFVGLIASIMATMPLARYVARLLSQPSPRRPSTIVRILKRDMVAGLLAIVLFTLPLVLYSFASHAAFAGGTTKELGWLLTLGTFVLTVILALPSSVTFVNRSSLSQTYAARLARAYLGASNPLRQRPDGRDVTEVIPGDDVAAVTDYRPHLAGGPLHLMNLTLSQTVDGDSQLAKRDRQGENLSVSCLGLTVGETAHSLWVSSPVSADAAPKRPVRIQPVGWSLGDRHPLVDVHGNPADCVEMLSLRQWVALSGAAIDPGRGRSTQLGTALLMGLVNLRTGYWWDSSISHADRGRWPDLSFVRRLMYLIPQFFVTQSLVLAEWIARFHGTASRFWHLSDGGYFENLGAYELIRRRMPRIIICDCGADAKYELEDLAELTRKVRIDFGASIEPYTPPEGTVLPASIGSLQELVPVSAPGSDKPAKSLRHAALFKVSFSDNPLQRCMILYIKATLTGDEAFDVGNYHLGHPEFPHEATADQFFDEPQWESHRQLGEHIAEQVIGDGQWFWNLPV